MGSFNLSCQLTHDMISPDDEIVAVMLSGNNKTSMLCYPWDKYSPIPIMFEGTYDSYGGMKNVRIFQSQNSMSDTEEKALRDMVFTYMKSTMKGIEDVPKSLDDLVNTHMEFITPDFKASILKQYIDMAEYPNTPPNMFDGNLKAMGFENMDDAKKYVADNAENKSFKPMQVVFFKKSPLLMLLNTYGLGKLPTQDTEDEEDEKHYSTVLQNYRQGNLDGNETEMIDYISGKGNYAGGNNPLFTFDTIARKILKGSYSEKFSEKDKKALSNVKNTLDKMSMLHSIDLSLVNDYFTMIGKMWTPSVYMSEESEQYGQPEAYKMQQELLNYKNATKTLKMK